MLRWAADNDHGHRAFLQLGGEQLILEEAADALMHSALILRGYIMGEILTH